MVLDRYTGTPVLSSARKHSLGFGSRVGGSREQLLQDLEDIVFAAEQASMNILRSFDIDDEPPYAETEEDDDKTSYIQPQSPESPVANPFLSTPLRLKHFSRLSPSILESLLRSPSIRIPTPDNSFDPSELSISLLKSRQSERWDMLPMTPPPTGRLDNLFTPSSHAVDNEFSSNQPYKPLMPGSAVSPTATKNFKLVVAEIYHETGSRQTQKPSEPVRHLAGQLEVEFASLLLKNAAEESRDANQLRLVADRLDVLAMKRKDLVEMILSEKEWR
ncbi:hypothetical protein C8J56DRAFT_1163281 [Mycena floridula]|nr:hypothetical protein C8J56DRAFT_1163281 [Mycena floridula]